MKTNVRNRRNVEQIWAYNVPNLAKVYKNHLLHLGHIYNIYNSVWNEVTCVHRSWHKKYQIFRFFLVSHITDEEHMAISAYHALCL